MAAPLLPRVDHGDAAPEAARQPDRLRRAALAPVPHRGEVLHLPHEEEVAGAVEPPGVLRIARRARRRELSEEALIDILTKPRNALVKQYQKLFEMDGVKLRFTKGALKSVSTEALKTKAGARGLRAIVEGLLLETMYEIPSHPNIKEVLVNEEVVQQQQQPLLIYHPGSGSGAPASGPQPSATPASTTPTPTPTPTPPAPKEVADGGR